MTAAELLQKTASALPAFNPSSLTAIEKGGSSRCFFRVLSSENKSAILVQDLGEKEENRH